jgi:phosphoglycerate dehydrogenase-like enzyme
LREISPRLNIQQHYPKVPDKAWQTADVLFTFGSVPEPQQAPNLKWVQLVSAGVEHVKEQPIVTEGDVMVTSTSGIHATAIAEYCLGMMLAWEYNLPRLLDDQRELKWREKRYEAYAPRHLRGQTVGIAGYGSIGRELARQADALGMTVLASKRDVMHPADRDSYREAGTGDPEGEIPERIYPSETLGTMAKDCDYLVILTPLTESTHHMVDETIFSAMKKSAVIINVARGSVIDEQAMIQALEKEQIAGAILDVFETEPLPPESPLWQMENVIITPHIAGNSARYHEKATAVFAENLQRYINGKDLLNLLDLDRGY